MKPDFERTARQTVPHVIVLSDYVDALRTDVQDALTAAFSAGLERAAEICEKDGWEYSHTARELSAAIRAEKEPQ